MSDIQDNLEQLFRERFNDFEANVDPSIWEAVQSQIPAPSAPPADGGITQTGGKVIFGQFSTSAVVTITSIAAAAIIAIGIYSYTSDDEMPTQPNNELVEQEENVAPAIEQQNEIIPEIQDQVVVGQDEQNVAQKEVDVNEQKPSTNEVEGYGSEEPRFTELVNSTSKEPLDSEDEPKMHNAKLQVEVNSSPNEEVGLPKEVGHVANVNEEPETIIPPEVTLEALNANIEHQKIEGAPYTFKFKNLGQSSYHEWDMGDGSQSIEDDPEYTFNGPGEYLVKLTVRAQDGRTMTDEVIVNVFERSELIFPPTAFSPNGDLQNDVYDLEGKNIQKVTVKVLSYPSGQLVFSSDSFEKDWAGEDNSGRQLPEGQYGVVIEALGYDSILHRKQEMVNLYR